MVWLRLWYKQYRKWDSMSVANGKAVCDINARRGGDYVVSAKAQKEPQTAVANRRYRYSKYDDTAAALLLNVT